MFLRRPSTALPAAALLAAALSAPALLAQAPPPPAQEPDPSYLESAVSAYRHPGLDTDVFLFINHWRTSVPIQDHGGLIERDILTAGDPAKPPRKGAVLKYIKSYRRAVLPPRCDTVPFKSAAQQTFFYVNDGKGKAEAGGKIAALEEGVALMMPAGLEYKFSNPYETPVEMVVVTEEIEPGFVPDKEMSVGTYHASLPTTGVHWAHVGHALAYDVAPRFSNPMGFTIVSIDTFDIAQPHVHGPGTEEIWCQLKGTSLLLFGNRLLRQEPLEAFLVPPNNKVPHSSINPGSEPMLWLYMGNRHDQRKK